MGSKTFSLISIHALLAESDLGIAFTQAKRFEFLSTLSLRRATGQGDARSPGQEISIHALLAESDVFFDTLQALCDISIHALLAESDVAPVLAVGRA